MGEIVMEEDPLETSVQRILCAVVASVAVAAIVGGLPAPADAVLARLSDDAHVSLSARTANFGSAPALVVQGPGPTAAQAYLRFDLTTLPAGTRGADVARAVLRLWVAKVSRGGMFDVYSVRGGWSEDAVTAANAPGRGRDELIGIPVSLGDRSRFLVVDMTELVQEWLDRTLENNGVVLMPNAAGVSVEFDSKENTGTSHEPELEITLRATGAAGPAGPPGPPGPPGSPGERGPVGPPAAAPPPRTAAVAAPPLPSGAIGGLREYRASGTWTAPAGVTRVMVEAWGAGGAGGAGSPGAQGGGGGGGAGAYQRAVLNVVPGTAYDLIVGDGGQPDPSGGGDGRDTQVRDATTGTVLLSVRPGQGGRPGHPDGTPGAGGGGGRAEPSLGLGRDGGAGGAGEICRPAALSPSTCLGPARGGAGGATARGSVEPPPRAGAGGAGGDGGRAGLPGGSGYVLVLW